MVAELSECFNWRNSRTGRNPRPPEHACTNCLREFSEFLGLVVDDVGRHLILNNSGHVNLDI